jgi:hypothetical protein
MHDRRPVFEGLTERQRLHAHRRTASRPGHRRSRSGRSARSHRSGADGGAATSHADPMGQRPSRSPPLPTHCILAPATDLSTHWAESACQFQFDFQTTGVARTPKQVAPAGGNPQVGEVVPFQRSAGRPILTVRVSSAAKATMCSTVRRETMWSSPSVVRTGSTVKAATT